MSTTTVAPARAEVTRPTTTHKLSFGHLLKSEWIKFWSVRSTIWTLAITAVALVGFTVLLTLAMVNAPDDAGAPTNPLDAFGLNVYLGPLAVAVLGALSITGEYTTGMIRSSLTAEPRRTPVLWAKALVLFVVVFVVSAASIAVAALLQAAIFGGDGMTVDVYDSQTLRALTGYALYISMIGLLSFALGALMRHSAAAIATVLGALLILPIMFSAIPWEPLHKIMPFLPNVAGAQVTQTNDQIAAMAAAQPDVITLSAWAGFGVLAAYVVVVLAAAAVLLKRRDA
ncbi:ABC transporter permease [Cellulomonas chitinilytica]|uniref:ABC transporter permease n=1 Tax=Cellulomonas chitinilytica TaxID=398759 RepID=A0A919NZ28_9CELL|nr:ABC transporter permease subunit [Cellulomonas chitinilytica]GIG19645.1 ABC transporter permease [Cellulomonas chitinilytica]